MTWQSQSHLGRTQLLHAFGIERQFAQPTDMKRTVR